MKRAGQVMPQTSMIDPYRDMGVPSYTLEI